MTKTLHSVFGIFGDLTGLFLFLAPTITFKRIILNKSTEQFSGIPYSMTMLNCALSAWYGLPFVSSNNILVSALNGTGAGIEAIYVLIFLIYAPKKEKLKLLGIFTFVLTVFCTIAFISIFALHRQKRKIFCGLAAAIFSVIMYGSPLSAMRLVIRTRSVEYMPFFLSLFSFLCGTSWFIFGLLGKDLFVAIPNGVGGGLGILQLILYAIYYKDKAKLQNSTKDESSLEMGFAGRDHRPRIDGQKPSSENGEMQPGGGHRSSIDGQKPLRS
ncbi:Bidirectional sugar transporter SWEET [Heracleum sosnowskyi]|uniref:Bidirectional sugar transporter SWEET n=1 Tax=Heracleum sosnowskyi TaxID=360622 RepID=A0AAD8M6E3_9APIA|nr:Bidirectional sugar transporter SWEET [Heracleum sosnowskyi]